MYYSRFLLLSFVLLFGCTVQPEKVKLEDFGELLLKKYPEENAPSRQLCVVFTKQACPTCIRALCSFAEKLPQPEQLRVFAYGFRSEKDLRLALGKPCLELLRPKHFPDFPKDVEEYDYGNVYFWLIENQKSIHFTELTPWLLGNEFVELLGFLKGTMWQK